LFAASAAVFLSVRTLRAADEPCAYDGAKPAPHPRLFLTTARESETFDAIKQNPPLAALNATLLKECDAILKLKPLAYKKTGKRLLNVSREVLRRVFYLSWAYRFTGDEKYFDRAKAEMMSAAAFPDWNPAHFLDVGEMALAISVGHDWLYEKLTPQERAKLYEAVKTKAFDAALNEKNAWFLKSANNWNQICNSGLVCAALSFYEDDPAACAAIIKRSLASNPKALKSYAPDGAYPEGSSYWNYGSEFQAAMFAALESAFGKASALEESEGFLNSTSYLHMMRGQSGYRYNYSDCSSGRLGLQIIFPWFIKRTGDASILEGQLEELAPDKLGANMKTRLLPFIFIYGADLDYANVPPFKARAMFFRGEVPVFAARLTNAKGRKLYLAGKGGSAYAPHAHMDAGSFVFESDGIRWALDLGPQSYESIEREGVNLWDRQQKSERWGLFAYSNLSHNTLTLNGARHIANGKTEMLQTFDTPQKIGAVFDMTKTLGQGLKSAVREIAIIDETYAETVDTIETGAKPASIEWRLCTHAIPEICEDEKSIILKDESGKTLLIKAECEGAQIAAKTWSAKPKNAFEKQNEGVSMAGFAFEVPQNSKCVLMVKMTPRN